MSRKVHSPVTSTVFSGVGRNAGELWIGGREVVEGVLSDAMMTWAANGFKPARRRKISHCEAIVSRCGFGEGERGGDVQSFPRAAA